MWSIDQMIVCIHVCICAVCREMWFVLMDTNCRATYTLFGICKFASTLCALFQCNAYDFSPTHTVNGYTYAHCTHNIIHSIWEVCTKKDEITWRKRDTPKCVHIVNECTGRAHTCNHLHIHFLMVKWFALIFQCIRLWWTAK